jgi:hypothetical protein
VPVIRRSRCGAAASGSADTDGAAVGLGIGLLSGLGFWQAMMPMTTLTAPRAVPMRQRQRSVIGRGCAFAFSARWAGRLTVPALL